MSNLSLEVPPGIIFAFLGPDGAGKTTTIRLLLGLLDPTEGHCEVLGLDSRTHGREIREQSGALLEQHGLYEGLTVEENLEFYGRIHRWPKSRRAARSEEVLVRYGLWDRRTSPTRLLSKGMKQRLAIARAVLHSPPVMFLDEPTSGLDPAATAALREDLIALASREGVTIFLTSHNLTEVEQMASLAGMIRNGKLQAFGTIADISAYLELMSEAS